MKTKFKILFMLALLGTCCSTNSDWPVLYRGEFPESNNGAIAITTDNEGNCYVTGSSQTTDQGEIFFHTITTIKYNSSGVLVWKKVYDYHYGQAKGKSIIYDESDPQNPYIYVAGQYENPYDNYKADIIVIQYNANNGDENWIRTYDANPNRAAYANKITYAGNGSVYVVGQTNGFYDGQEWREFYLTTIKYSSNGNREWVARYYNNYNDIGYSVDIDPNNGDVYVTGASSNGSNNDFIVIKYNSEGQLQWDNRYNSGGDDYGTDIAFFPSHAAYATGTSTVSGGLRMTTIKYNKNTGERIWVRNDYTGIGYSIGLYQRWFGNGWNTFTVDVFVTGYGGTYPNNNYGQTIRYSNSGGQDYIATYYGTNPTLFNSLRIDEYENVFVAGYDHLISTDEYNWYTVKYDGLLNLQWDDQIATYHSQGAMGLSLDNSGNAYVTGFASPMPYDSMLSFNDPYESYYFTMKYPYDYGDNILSTNNSFNEIPERFSLNQNFPNPFNPVTKIQYAIPQNGYVMLKVYDMLGREVKTLVNEYKNAGYYDVDFDGSNLSSGVYVYKLQSGVYSDIKKMILIK